MDSKHLHVFSKKNSLLFLKHYKRYFQIGLRLLGILGIIFTIYGFYWGYRQELFTSDLALSQFLQSVGPLAPFLFMMLQIIQTMFPLIPGGLTIPGGLMIFGMGYGYLLNFVGIMIGSIINFTLARKFGRPLVQSLMGNRTFNRYVRWLDNPKQFKRLFIFGMFFPLSPADLLCYLAGLSDLSYRDYLLILSLGKPIALFLYSYGMVEILNRLFQLL